MVPAEKLSKALMTQPRIQQRPSQLAAFKRFFVVWMAVVFLGMLTVTRFAQVAKGNYAIDGLQMSIVDAKQQQAKLDAKIASLENPARLQAGAALHGAHLASSFFYVPVAPAKTPGAVPRAASRWAQVVGRIQTALAGVVHLFH